MPLTRRVLLAAPLLAPLSGAAQEAFPSRPIRMIIPVGVAGVTDIVGRIIADHMSITLGKPVVPENIVGAGSTVGAAAFQRTAPDGHTIFIGTNNHPVMKALYPNFPFDPVADFIPFCLVGRQPFVLAVNPSVPAQNVPSLLSWLRQQKEAANYGSANPGATNHLAGELLRQLAGVTFTIVPYRTASNAVQDLMAGRMQLSIDSPSMMAPLIRDGRLRGLAVSGPSRFAQMPDLPTLSEAGVPGYDLTAWQVLFVRPGTPPEALAVLEDAARRAVADPEVKAKLLQANVETWPDPSPAAAAAHVKAEVARWAPVVRAMHPNPG
ncbi:MAG: tripartite tricarboxylate transporter substrate binding protein [Acetobacteraceae bacterium]|nr:tripartite tricarboxylate transporter substrate binding protein [Acetobacteraceae bacterium]